jgi:hypothetical protein
MGTECEVEFDENGRVARVEAPEGQWTQSQSGQSTYLVQEAGSLLRATELLLKLDSIPGLTYYVVDTPDGSLGRDVQGLYTEAPLKTENLVLETEAARSEDTVELESLTGFGEMMAYQTSVAHLKMTGNYARLMLLMECGRCGYKSPVETEPGELVRQCYCCGTVNKGQRGTINVFLGSTGVEI